MLHIHLHDFVTGARACVLYFDRDLNGAIRGHGWRAEFQCFVGKRRLTQAVAEGIEGLVLAVHIGAAMVQIVVHHRRQLPAPVGQVWVRRPAGA